MMLDANRTTSSSVSDTSDSDHTNALVRKIDQIRSLLSSLSTFDVVDNDNTAANSGTQEQQSEGKKQSMITILQEAYHLYTSMSLFAPSRKCLRKAQGESTSSTASANDDDTIEKDCGDVDHILDHHFNCSMSNFEMVFYLGKEIVSHLESLLEDIAYTFNDADVDTCTDSNSDHGDKNFVVASDFNDQSKGKDDIIPQHLLEYIANIYKQIVLLVDHRMDNIRNCNTNTNSHDNNKCNNSHDHNTTSQSTKNAIKTNSQYIPLSIETVEELYLDYAFSSKRANNVQDCLDGHIRRMNLFSTWPCPNQNNVENDDNSNNALADLKNLRVMDAVRLLGLQPFSALSTAARPLQNDSPVVEEICRDGIFHSILMVNRGQGQDDVDAAGSRKEGLGEEGDEQEEDNDNNRDSFSEKEAEYKSPPRQHQQVSKNLEKWYPSQSAILFGQKLRKIFIQFNYSFESCHDILAHLLVLKHKVHDNTCKKEELQQRSSNGACSPHQKQCRFFSAHSFFDRRRDLLSIPRTKRKKYSGSCSKLLDIINQELYNDLPGTNELKVLAYLFLFGVALEKNRVIEVLGTYIVQTFVNARLLSPCYSNISSRDGSKDGGNDNSGNDDLFVAECQIYPLHVNCFEGQKDIKSSDYDCNNHSSVSNEMNYPLFFITDWPLESMRLPRDAIMPVGYDTLELLSLSSGSILFKNDEKNHNNQRECPGNRVLDLCCGCGIQGIFAAARKCMLMEGSNISSAICHELFCMDINERAKHFVTGNISLNGLSVSSRNVGCSTSIEICFVHGDIYDPIQSQCTEYNTHSPQALPASIGKFDHILSNPPFVAVPKVIGSTSLSPALYSAGGGVDGMDLLRRILIDCFRILNFQKTVSVPTMLIVTELPNVEDSCELILSMLDRSSAQVSRIRVAYVESDVESMEEYSREREIEAGFQINGRDWSNPSNDCIRNRALVLISISSSRGDESIKLASFDQTPIDESDTKDVLDEIDCEDAFLTKKGIAFSRNFLL